MTLAPGTPLGPYEITAPLGAGGMGEVYRAKDTRLGRDVAIKALPAEFARDPERLARFEREAKLLASLSHPNIAGIHGLEEVDKARYLVLEFVDGETLAERLSRGALPLDEAIQVARQIAAGVEAAHESGVIHRDLKPGNVMLAASGAVKVLDFGLAKSGVGDSAGSNPSLSASPTMTHAATQAGVILGTAAYMSPEQARGRPVDKRTDIWSFGCVLYECLTGKPMFEGETVSDLIAHILTVEPDWSALPAATPGRVRELLRRCLRKDAKERLRDIGEARIALGAPEEAGVSAIRSGSHGVPWPVTAGVALIVAAIAVFATFRYGHRTRPQPVRRFDLIASDMVIDWDIAPRLSPDGSRFAYASASRIWVRDLDQLAPRPVAELHDAGAFAWSPDSREIVYGDDRKLWKVAVEGGTPTAICEISGTGKIIGATWSVSGTIAFSVWRDRMYQVSAGGGRAATLIDIDPVTQIDFHAPAWLPGGDLLYVTHWKSDRDSTGQARDGLTLFDGRKQIGIPGDFGNMNDTPVFTPAGRLLYLVTGVTHGIWVVPFDVTRRRPAGTPVLVAPEAVSLSASADGSLLYVEGSSVNVRRELVWVDRTGQAVETVGVPHLELDHPRLSPDGRRVAFSAAEGGNDDIWVLDLKSGAETRLTFGPQSETSPEWLASSSRLAFVERQSDDLQGRILSINADGSGGQRVFAPTAYSGWWANCVNMAPDGTSAIRVIDQRGHGSLQIGPVLPDGTLGAMKPVFAQTPEPNINGARISPDGRLLAYQTNDPGQVDVFLTRFPGGEGQWQVGTQGGGLPRWARESRELFFFGGSGPTSRRMIAVKVDSDLDTPIGSLTPLFESTSTDDVRDYDVSADGRRLLFARPAGGGDRPARHLVLVQNWPSGIAVQ